MNRKGFVIDTQKLTIEREVTYDDTVFDGLYVKDVNASAKEGANILFAAFTFPIEHKEAVSKLLKDLAAKKKEWEDFQAQVYYKEFPKYRR